MSQLKNNDKVTDSLEKSVRFVTLVGLLLNLVLAALKFMAGYLGHSQALVADAVHSLSDTVSDIAVIVGSYYWFKPADHDHPYGHRRIETIVTILVGVILVIAGLGIINEALQAFRGGERQAPSYIAAIAALLSIVIKETLYRWTAAVGNKVKSKALIANAWHHRTDAFSSIPALMAIVGSMLVPSWQFLDQIGAVVISFFIFYAAYEIIYGGIKELVDSSAPPEVCEKILSLACQVSGVGEVHGLRTRYAGAMMYVDLHVLVDGGLTVLEGHDIAELVKDKLLGADLDILDIIVHVEPL